MPGTGYDLLDLSEEELDVQLGDALYADEFGAKDASDVDKRRRAENWFTAQAEALRQVVCGRSFVRGYVGDKGAERELFDALVAALAAFGGIAVPVGVLAAKIVRYGVTKLCPIDESSPPSVPATAS